MQTHTRTRKHTYIVLTDQEFQHLLGFIESDAGIRLPETNYQIVRQFIGSRLADLHLSFAEYLTALKNQQAEEYNRFLDTITINETYFFREQKHFQVLERMIMPQFSTSGATQMRLWSAACSTGEEAVSLMAMAERSWGQTSTRTYAVMASDINPYALSMFRAGEFKANSFREDGNPYHPLLHAVLRKNHDRWTLNAAAQPRLDIRHLNVFRDDLAPFANQFQVVFLRNMLVYMAMPIRRKILDNIVPTLKEGGYLFLASSEMPLISHVNLMLEEYDHVYFFRKKTLQDKQRGFVFDQQVLQDIQQPAPPTPLGRPASPRPSQETVNLDEILLFANQKLNNHLFTALDNPNYAIALNCLHVVVLINEKKLPEARPIIDDIARAAGVNEVTCYFSGYLEMIDNRPESAMRLLRQALHYNAHFWPARFYLAMLLRPGTPRAAAQEFIRCQESISAYIQQNRRDYQCVLEGFNAKYFLNMCQKLTSSL